VVGPSFSPFSRVSSSGVMQNENSLFSQYPRHYSFLNLGLLRNTSTIINAWVTLLVFLANEFTADIFPPHRASAKHLVRYKNLPTSVCYSAILLKTSFVENPFKKRPVRYRSPASGRIVTIVFPLNSSLLASFRATAIAAPQLTPERIPSSRARRLACSIASSLVTCSPDRLQINQECLE